MLSKLYFFDVFNSHVPTFTFQDIFPSRAVLNTVTMCKITKIGVFTRPSDLNDYTFLCCQYTVMHQGNIMSIQEFRFV